MRLDSNYVRLHIVNALKEFPLATIRFDDFDIVVADFPDGQAAAICLMERPTSLSQIISIFKEHAAVGIHTVFILWCEMLLPEHNDIYDPPNWLLALHTLQNNQLYAYKTVGDEVDIFAVHFERIGHGPERLVKHGGLIDVADLGCAYIDVSGRKLRDGGAWRILCRVGPRSGFYQARMEREHHYRRHRRYQQPPERPMKPDPMLVYYHILGVSEGADWDDIKRAYRDLARQYHPDLNTTLGAKERMQQINMAYAYLLELHDDDSVV